MGHRPKLQECLKLSPAAHLPKWRSTLRGFFLTEIDGHKIVKLQDVDKAVRTAREATKLNNLCTFSIINKIAIHPQLSQNRLCPQYFL